jgi:hypothetical protein
MPQNKFEHTAFQVSEYGSYILHYCKLTRRLTKTESDIRRTDPDPSSEFLLLSPFAGGWTMSTYEKSGPGWMLR